MDDNSHVIFTYGTLKRGHGNHHFLSGENSRFVGNGSVNGFMLNIGSFPGLIPSKDQKMLVKGEIWLVGTDTLERIDHLEGEGGLYLRQAVKCRLTVTDLEVKQLGNAYTGNEAEQYRLLPVWVYFWNGSKNYPIITSGQWK